MQTPQCCFQRYEKKYLLDPGQLSHILSGVAPHTRPDEYGRYPISSLYYDTRDFRLIRASLEKPVYKEKLRLRSYGPVKDGQMVFVELKKKYDGVVYKRRVAMDAAGAAAYVNGGARPAEEGQICREIDWFLRFYRPVPQVLIACDRTALAGTEDQALRITFDRDLRWRATELDLRRGDYGAPLLPPDKTLMEIKFPGASPLWLSHLLSETGAFPVSFSKYGTCYREHLSPAAGEEARICA